MVSKRFEDYEASIANLTFSIQAFEAGNRQAYRIIAVELRKLMCDGKSSLLTRIFEDIHLHKLHWTKILEEMPSLRDGLELIMPGQLTTKGNLASFTLGFSNTLELIPLSEWVEQLVLSPTITIREMIKSVADKEGAHADENFNDTLLFSRGVRYGDFYSHVLVIVAVGSYLLDFLAHEKLERRTE